MGVADVGLVDCNLHGLGQRDRVLERAARVAGMVGVIDAPALDHQKEAFLAAREHVDGLGRHLGDGRLAGRVLFAVGFVLHVRALEQTEQVPGAGRVDGVELGLVPHSSIG